ncbi:MAG TPA: SEC-C metal-binding domain-containing protein [Verrucomicrobiales bacterium]|nr:SEC-C metal-binding domain-containing protein [Verrucomicrobiales bacterium]
MSKNKIGVNQKCPCGSDRKYKKCCANADRENAQTSRGVLRKSFSVEPGEDFFNRFIVQMSDIRKCVIDSDDRDTYQESYECIFQNLVEARLARAHVKDLISDHNRRLQTKEDGIIHGHQIDIVEPIDDDLNLFFKDFFIRGVMVIDQLFEDSARMGYPIKNLFSEQEKKRCEAIENFPLTNEDERFKSLLAFIDGHKASWYGKFKELRTMIEHRGWSLPPVSYQTVPGNRVAAKYPQVLGIGLVEIIEISWNNLTNLCEEILVFIAGLKLPDNLIMVKLSEEEQELIRVPVRYAVRLRDFPGSTYSHS